MPGWAAVRQGAAGPRQAFALSVCLVAGSITTTPAGAEPIALGTGAQREVSFSSSRCIAFTVPSEAGAYAQVEIEQLGVDTYLELPTVARSPGTDPRPHPRTIDRPIGAWGRERTSIVIDAGHAAFSVCAFSPVVGGRFRITVDGPRPEGPADRARRLGEDLFWHARHRESRAGDVAWQRVVGDYRGALARFDEASDSHWRAMTLVRLGIALRRADRPAEATPVLVDALPLLAATGEHRQAAEAYNELAMIARRHGRVDQAVGYYEHALDHARGLPDLRLAAVIEGNLARAHLHRGAYDLAIASLERQLGIWRRTDAPPREVIETLNDLAEAYDHAGEPHAALETVDRALTEIDTARAAEEEAHARVLRGRILLALEQPEEALADLEPAAQLAVRSGDWRVHAAALNTIGRAWRESGRIDDAVTALRRALRLYEHHGEHRSAAILRTNLASALDELGDIERAHAEYRLAGESFAGLGDDLGVAASRFGLGRSFLRGGEAARALPLLHQAREGVEKHRTTLSDRQLGTAFLADKHRYFALEVDAVMRLASGAEEGVAKAFELAERARARDLWQRLRDGSGAQHAGASGAVDLVNLQRRLTDSSTQILAFTLGELRSYVWRIDRREVASAALPPRAEIERQVRAVARLMRAPPAPHATLDSAAALRALAGTLLAPAIRDGLTAPRIAVIPDGALHYLPFAALPDPAAGRAPLLERFEIVRLPSIAVLDELRRRAHGRTRASGVLAVLADPVTDPADPRLGGVAVSDVSTTTPQPFGRLPFAAQEARDILDLVPAEERFEALGLAASLDTVRQPALADYRIVHFATHGFIDERRPERSGLVLSAFDAAGARRPSVLSLGDVYRLRLGADLVVLSACQTALGKDLDGEGLVGLMRGFLFAGAPRVVVSLWPVDDRSTARLMLHFYRALLERDLAPAAALRHAQRTLRAEPGREAPFYWAGFVLVGDWL